MRTVIRIFAALAGATFGLFLSFIYLANIMAGRSSMKMILYFPMWDFYRLTLYDYFLAGMITLVTAAITYMIVNWLMGQLSNKNLHPAV